MEDVGVNAIRCTRVEISDAMICEICRTKTVTSVRREDIRHIKLTYDTSAKYPFFQFFFGFILISLGFIGLIVAWLASSVVGEPIDIDPDQVRVPIIPIFLWLMIVSGVWNLAKVFRASYHLLIETEDGLTKVFFEKSAKLEDIQKFVRKVCWQFGYEIDTSHMVENAEMSS